MLQDSTYVRYFKESNSLRKKINVWKALRGNHMKAKEEKHSIGKVTLDNIIE